MSKVLNSIKLDKSYKYVEKLDDNFEIKFKLILKKNTTPQEKTFLEYFLRQNKLQKKLINDIFCDASGTCKDICNIFNTEINLFKKDNKTYFSDINNLTIPQELYFISNIIGLNNIPKYKPFYKINNEKNTKGYTPVQIGEFYDFPFQFRGSNRVISIIQLGGGFRQKDLDYYFLQFLNLDTRPQVLYYTINGAKNDPDSPDSGEVYLDIETAGAIAKCSLIIVYFAPNNDLGFYEAIYFAMNNLNYSIPTAISISWGSSERYNSTAYMESMNDLFGIARKYNINIFCASGDDGSSDGAPGLNVDFPASCPNGIGCGGTTMIVKDNKLIEEVVWPGSGGGFSKIFPAPEYQKLIGGTRGVPDIAGNADPSTGYIIYINGKFSIVGGTSAVAPLYAGLTALISEAKGSTPYLNPTIYSFPKEICYDVTKGSNGPNGKWDAKVGWDPCTGNGRIYGDKLLLY